MSHTAHQGMTRNGLRAVITLFEMELKQLKNIKQGCGDCEYSEHRKDGTCKKWNQTVPPEHRAAGCDEWTYDEVPFDRRAPVPASKPGIHDDYNFGDEDIPL